eukprot:763708-Hanusia_phi.AAC.4
MLPSVPSVRLGSEHYLPAKKEEAESERKKHEGVRSQISTLFEFQHDIFNTEHFHSTISIVNHLIWSSDFLLSACLVLTLLCLAGVMLFSDHTPGSYPTAATRLSSTSLRERHQLNLLFISSHLI